MLTFGRRERKVASLMCEYLEAAQSCLEAAKNTLCAYLDGNEEDAVQLTADVGRLETEADTLRHRVRDELFSGAYLPLIREDVYRLVEALDHVPNAVEGCCRFFASQHPQIPEQQREAFREIIIHSLATPGPLFDGVKLYFKRKVEFSDVRGRAEQVDAQESKVDALEFALTSTIFHAEELDFPHRLHLREALRRIVRVSDKAEDAAEVLELASLKAIV